MRTHPHTLHKITKICASGDGNWLLKRITDASQDTSPNKKHLAQMRTLAASLLEDAHSSDKFSRIETVAEILWLISHPSDEVKR